MAQSASIRVISPIRPSASAPAIRSVQTRQPRLDSISTTRPQRRPAHKRPAAFQQATPRSKGRGSKTAGTTPFRLRQTQKMTSMARDGVHIHTQARGQGSGRPTRSSKQGMARRGQDSSSEPRVPSAHPCPVAPTPAARLRRPRQPFCSALALSPSLVVPTSRSSSPTQLRRPRRLLPLSHHHCSVLAICCVIATNVSLPRSTTLSPCRLLCP